jgi:hypothetical protein
MSNTPHRRAVVDALKALKPLEESWLRVKMRTVVSYATADPAKLRIARPRVVSWRDKERA